MLQSVTLVWPIGFCNICMIDLGLGIDALDNTASQLY